MHLSRKFPQVFLLFLMNRLLKQKGFVLKLTVFTGTFILKVISFSILLLYMPLNSFEYSRLERMIVHPQ